MTPNDFPVWGNVRYNEKRSNESCLEDKWFVLDDMNMLNSFHFFGGPLVHTIRRQTIIMDLGVK